METVVKAAMKAVTKAAVGCVDGRGGEGGRREATAKAGAGRPLLVVVVLEATVIVAR